MSQDLFAALALMLVLEGILPFISPGALRRVARQMSETSDASLRVTGLVSMLAGLALLYLVRH